MLESRAVFELRIMMSVEVRGVNPHVMIVTIPGNSHRGVNISSPHATSASNVLAGICVTDCVCVCVCVWGPSGKVKQVMVVCIEVVRKVCSGSNNCSMPFSASCGPVLVIIN